jgi:hypothetical protein
MCDKCVTSDEAVMRERERERERERGLDVMKGRIGDKLNRLWRLNVWDVKIGPQLYKAVIR